MLNRRKFVASLGTLGLVSVLDPAALRAGRRRVVSAEGPVFRCKPYLQVVPEKGLAVRWVTRIPCHSWVEYGEHPDRLDRRARQVQSGMVQVNNTIHTIHLTDLQPGSTCYYRVVSQPVLTLKRREAAFGEPVQSDVYVFRHWNENQQEASFLVFNDIHDRPESFSALMHHRSPKSHDFVLLNGDMFNFVETEDQIVDHLLNPLAGLVAATAPVVYSRGNHETWGNYARNFPAYAGGTDGRFYQGFRCGPLYVLVLDSGETKPDTDPVNAGVNEFDAYRREQADWLKQEVRKEAFTSAVYRVVLVHIPPFYIANEAHAATHYGGLWGAVLNEAGIDLMICGHTHKRGVHPAVPGKHTYPIVIGGGPKDGNRTMMEVRANSRMLKLEMFDDAGNTVHTLEVPAG